MIPKEKAIVFAPAILGTAAAITLPFFELRILALPALLGGLVATQLWAWYIDRR